MRLVDTELLKERLKDAGLLSDEVKKVVDYTKKVDPDDYFNAADRIKPCPGCRYYLLARYAAEQTDTENRGNANN